MTMLIGSFKEEKDNKYRKINIDLHEAVCALCKINLERMRRDCLCFLWEKII